MSVTTASYIGICLVILMYTKEPSPAVWQILPGTFCIWELYPTSNIISNNVLVGSVVNHLALTGLTDRAHHSKPTWMIQNGLGLRTDAFLSFWQNSPLWYIPIVPRSIHVFIYYAVKHNSSSRLPVTAYIPAIIRPMHYLELNEKPYSDLYISSRMCVSPMAWM